MCVWVARNSGIGKNLLRADFLVWPVLNTPSALVICYYYYYRRCCRYGRGPCAGWATCSGCIKAGEGIVAFCGSTSSNCHQYDGGSSLQNTFAFDNSTLHLKAVIFKWVFQPGRGDGLLGSPWSCRRTQGIIVSLWEFQWESSVLQAKHWIFFQHENSQMTSPSCISHASSSLCLTHTAWPDCYLLNRKRKLYNRAHRSCANHAWWPLTWRQLKDWRGSYSMSFRQFALFFIAFLLFFYHPEMHFFIFYMEGTLHRFYIRSEHSQISVIMSLDDESAHLIHGCFELDLFLSLNLMTVCNTKVWEHSFKIRNGMNCLISHDLYLFGGYIWHRSLYCIWIYNT